MKCLSLGLQYEDLEERGATVEQVHGFTEFDKVPAHCEYAAVNNWVNVTSYVATFLARGAVWAGLSEALGGDPSKGMEKVLRLRMAEEAEQGFSEEMFYDAEERRRTNFPIAHATLPEPTMGDAGKLVLEPALTKPVQLVLKISRNVFDEHRGKPRSCVLLGKVVPHVVMYIRMDEKLRQTLLSWSVMFVLHALEPHVFLFLYILQVAVVACRSSFRRPRVQATMPQKQAPTFRVG